MEDLEARVRAIEMLLCGFVAATWEARTLDEVLENQLPATQMRSSAPVFEHYERLLLQIRETQTALQKRPSAS